MSLQEWQQAFERLLLGTFSNVGKLDKGRDTEFCNKCNLV